MTGEQCRKARKLLRWTQEKLAKSLGVYQGHISKFERTGIMSRDPTGERDRIALLRGMFEAAGIEFVNETRIEASVRVRRAEQ